MRVVFHSIGSEQLGIELLGAILDNSGHETSLVFDPALFDDRYNIRIPFLSSLFDQTGRILKGILEQNPDVVAFSPVTGTYVRSIAIAKEVKAAKPEVKVIFGGVHTTALPELVISEKCVDAICIGEGDRAIVDIVNFYSLGMPKGRLNNIWYKDSEGNTVKGDIAPFYQDLDSLPFYKKAFFEEHIDIRSNYLTTAGRGCPYRCTFCFNNFWGSLPKQRSAYVRWRSPDHLMSELTQAKKRYDFMHVDFADDTFTLKKAWLKEFLPRFKKDIRRPFQCMTHVRFLDEETVRLLKESGCIRVQIGLESANQDYRRQYLKRFETNQDFEKALQYLEKHNLSYSIDHIFGLPGEPLEAQEEALNIYLRHKPWRINTFWLYYYPGTEISRIAFSEGYLEENTKRLMELGIMPGYHNPRNLDRNKMKAYLKYEVLFKSLPILGRSLEGLMNERWMHVLPVALLTSLGMLSDVGVNIFYRNMEMFSYAKYYQKNLVNYFHRTSNEIYSLGKSR